MSEIKFYIIDTETNGLNAKMHEMTEIGIIRFEDRTQLWRNIKCIYPERSSYDALKITGKTLADLNNGFNKEKVVEECNNFFSQDGLNPAFRCIVAHNMSFDKKFLHALWESCGQQFPANLWIDTIPMIRQFAKQNGIIKPKTNLQASCDLVGIKKFADKHNAKVDSKNTYLLFKSLIEDKKIDYLPFIKTFNHVLSNEQNDDLINFDEECA